MSDFSDLCPLFNAGVLKELTIPYMNLNSCSNTQNALGGVITRADNPASLRFDRTVIVENVMAAVHVSPATAARVTFARLAATGIAAMTVFASLSICTTADIHSVNRFRKMTQATNQTFLAADVLGISLLTQKAGGGVYSFIVKYKEF